LKKTALRTAENATAADAEVDAMVKRSIAVYGA
jgi:hypothetical protein